MSREKEGAWDRNPDQLQEINASFKGSFQKIPNEEGGLGGGGGFAVGW